MVRFRFPFFRWRLSTLGLVISVAILTGFRPAILSAAEPSDLPATGPGTSLAAAEPSLMAAQTPPPSLPGDPGAATTPAANLPSAAAPSLGGNPATPSSAAPAPVRGMRSQNFTINLINRLVERGVLTKEDSVELIRLAEQDAQEAKEEAATAQAAVLQAAAAQVAAAQSIRPPAAAPDAMPPSDAAPLSEDTVRVTYIPESVKAQLRDEIKQEVMTQARDEHWAAPRTFPEWVSRIKLFGDVRVRYEGDFFPSGNDNTGAFPNFNAINTGSPYDVSGTVFSPQLNVDQDRNRVRLRARFGLEADLGNGFTGGIRIATGDSNSPVSENQSFGLANQGQGGNFSKYAIWLDRGFIKYEAGGLPTKDFAILLGRFDNPFFNTTMIWADDLAFDGFVAQGKYQVARGFTPFATLGAFPVFNTDLNFSSIQPAKFSSHDKWLFGGQIGTNWEINKDFTIKLGIGYFDFENIEGKLSDPFTPNNSQDQGNTDNSRPSFAQKGNTYMALRNIVANVNNNFGTTNQFQYFGLATPFRDLTITARLDYNHFEPFRVSLLGEYIQNTAFDKAGIEAKAVNNRGPNNADGSLGQFAGGDKAWFVGLKVGSAALEKLWDWNIGLNYRYVESDAVVDGFCDSDFGGGGTNVKGFTVSGVVALSPRVNIGLRWMSADQTAGPPLKSDILQIDLNGKF